MPEPMIAMRRMAQALPAAREQSERRDAVQRPKGKKGGREEEMNRLRGSAGTRGPDRLHGVKIVARSARAANSVFMRTGYAGRGQSDALAVIRPARGSSRTAAAARIER
jgi:hypothetical protein